MRRKIRKILFSYSYIFGNSFSELLIRIGFLIKSSIWNKRIEVPWFVDRKEMYSFIVPQFNLNENEIVYLEFGVSKGWGFHFWYNTNKNQKSRFYGFDTFNGIPEDWGSVKKGAYSANGQVPEVKDHRCKFIVGMFQDTLADFIKNQSLKNQLVILLDADLYNATLFVMINIFPFLKKGDIIIFDEFFSVSKADHELRAFLDFISLYNLSYSAIAKTNNQLTIKVN